MLLSSSRVSPPLSPCLALPPHPCLSCSFVSSTFLSLSSHNNYISAFVSLSWCKFSFNTSFFFCIFPLRVFSAFASFLFASTYQPFITPFLFFHFLFVQFSPLSFCVHSGFLLYHLFIFLPFMISIVFAFFSFFTHLPFISQFYIRPVCFFMSASPVLLSLYDGTFISILPH